MKKLLVRLDVQYMESPVTILKENGCSLYIEAAELNVSDELIRNIEGWDEEFQATLAPYPPDSSFSSKDAEQKHRNRGYILKQCLQEELGDEYLVVDGAEWHQDYKQRNYQYDKAVILLNAHYGRNSVLIVKEGGCRETVDLNISDELRRDIHDWDKEFQATRVLYPLVSSFPSKEAAKIHRDHGRILRQRLQDEIGGEYLVIYLLNYGSCYVVTNQSMMTSAIQRLRDEIGDERCIYLVNDERRHPETCFFLFCCRVLRFYWTVALSYVSSFFIHLLSRNNH